MRGAGSEMFMSLFYLPSGGGGVAGADSAAAAEPDRAPPAGGSPAVQPQPQLSSSSQSGSAKPGPDLQQQPPGQTHPQGLQELTVRLLFTLIS